MKTCTIDACEYDDYYAKGMCRRHYRRSHARRADAKIELPCDGCGTLVLKEKRTRRYATVQCSSWACRVWLTHGVGWSEKLPADHWALNYGATCAWKPPKPPARVMSPHFNCAWCGKQNESTRHDNTYCDSRCKIAAKRIRRRGREHNAPGTYTWMDVTRLWVAFDKACAYCAQPTALTDIQAEHVQAISKGGRNDLSNLLPSCMPCNADKRDLSLTEWAADRERRGLPAVATEWHSTDMRYAHLSLPIDLTAAA